MITAEYTFSPPSAYPLDHIGSPEKLLFFDIETTGFSAAGSSLYLIGAASVTGGTWHLTQWFADRADGEEEVLQAFFSRLSSFDTLVHFNGDTFDIPYLEKRSEILGVSCPLRQMASWDIYKKIRPLKKLLGLDSLKQKAIEQFLGISREDRYSGGQLIQVYEDYLTTRDEELCRLLLLHNEEDLKGMPLILPILSYPDFLTGSFTLEEWTVWEETDIFGQKESFLEVTCRSRSRLPRPFSWDHPGFSGVSFSAEDDRLTLSIPILEDELKYFYPNYKDYYYLIYEDTAIHKSVGEYVDRDARKKATAATCYTKKRGRFLPQPEPADVPLFRTGYRSRTAYRELPEDPLSCPDFPAYIHSLILSSLGKGGRAAGEGRIQ